VQRVVRLLSLLRPCTGSGSPPHPAMMQVSTEDGSAGEARRCALSELRVLVCRGAINVCAMRTRPVERAEVRRTKACVAVAHIDVDVQLSRGIGGRQRGSSNASSIVAGRGRVQWNEAIWDFLPGGVSE
jgi:hypothetical protein